MRGFALPLGISLLLAGCGAEPSSNAIAPRNDATPVVNIAPTANESKAVAPGESAENRTRVSTPPEIPGVAEMSPYRRREYERGYRDCRAGNFDRERQGESYRIGCMAAQEASEAGR